MVCCDVERVALPLGPTYIFGVVAKKIIFVEQQVEIMIIKGWTVADKEDAFPVDRLCDLSELLLALPMKDQVPGMLTKGCDLEAIPFVVYRIRHDYSHSRIPATLTIYDQT